MLRRSERLFAEEGLDDISPAQAGVLMVLFQERRPMTARELSTSLELAEVTVSRFVTALEGAGWIARRPAPGDARARLIRPTQWAYDTLPTFIRISNALLDGAFQGFTHQELAALGRGVARLHQNLTKPEHGTG